MKGDKSFISMKKTLLKIALYLIMKIRICIFDYNTLGENLKLIGVILYYIIK